MRISASIILLVLTNLWSAHCWAQTYSYIISDKTITSLIKQVSKTLDPKVKKMDQEIIEWTEKDIYGEKDSLFDMGALTQGIIENELVKRHFSPKDLGYIEKQQDNLDWPKWQIRNFQNFELIDSIGFAKILSKSYDRKKVGSNFAYSFSIPLFSLNQELAIVQQEYFCGFECMNYCIVIYKKNYSNKTWAEIARLKCM